MTQSIPQWWQEQPEPKVTYLTFLSRMNKGKTFEESIKPFPGSRVHNLVDSISGNCEALLRDAKGLTEEQTTRIEASILTLNTILGGAQ